MIQLICHLVGDYVLQDHAMATRKTSSWRWAAVHVAFYMLPFLVALRPSPTAFAVMAGTHLVIDRLQLARFWCAFWGVGCEGWMARTLREAGRNRILDAWERGPGRSLGLLPDDVLAQLDAYDREHPVPGPAPEYLATWLRIIVDNSWHLAINAAALACL